MTPTLGDFLTIAGQRIAAADGNRSRPRVAGRADVIAGLDRLLTVMARYACDGADPAGAAVTSPVPTRQELTIIGIRLTLLRAAETIHQAAQTADTPASTGHPAAADLRAAADALTAGRDLLRTHDSATSHPAGDPLWASALTARPIIAALMRQLAGYTPHLAALTDQLLGPARHRPIPPATRQALQDAGKWLTLTASAHASERTSQAWTSARCSCTASPRTCPHPASRQQTPTSRLPNCAPARPPPPPASATSPTAHPSSQTGRPPPPPPPGGTTRSPPPSSPTPANCSCTRSPTAAASSASPSITRTHSANPPAPRALRGSPGKPSPTPGTRSPPAPATAPPSSPPNSTTSSCGSGA